MSDYEKQAAAFLDKYGIKFRATLSDSKPAPWSKFQVATPNQTGEGHHYRVTLSKSGTGFARKDGTSGNGRVCDNCGFTWVEHIAPNSRCPRSQAARLTFDFWSSVADAEKGITTVTPYDVLACISKDTHCADSFEEWCGDMCESTDSIRARQTYNRCLAFAKRLQSFFTAEEIEALREIQ